MGLSVLVLEAAAAFTLALAVAAFRPRWIVDHPIAVLVLLLALSTFAATALVRTDPVGLALEFDPSTEPLLPSGDPGQAFYRRATLEFGDDQVYVVAVRCPEVFSTPCLSVLDRITRRVARLPGVRSVGSLLDVTSFRYEAEQDWVVVEPFIDEVPTRPEVLADLRRRALRDPVYRQTIVSDDAKTAAINVRFSEMSDDEFIDSGLDARIRGIVAEETGTDSTFHVAGRPHIKVHVYEGMLHDVQFLIPLAIAVMAAVLWWFTGSLRGVVIPLFTALMANLWTFGAMAQLGFSLSLLTGLLGPMLLALGSVYGVHVLSRYEEQQAGTRDRKGAVLECLGHMRVPVVIAGFTTVVGFGALLITDVPAVFELGAFSMLGVASATVIVLTGVPSLLVLWPGSSSKTRTTHGLVGLTDRLLERGLGALGHWVTRRTAPILVVSAALVVVSVFAIPRIVVDTDYLSYFDEREPLRRDFAAVNRLLAGAIPLFVVIDGQGPGTFREPEVLAAVATLQERLGEVAGVSRTLSFLDSMRVVNRVFHEDDPSEERIPETRPGVTELLFLIPKSELSRFTTVNHGRSNVIVRTGVVGSSDINGLTGNLQAVIDRTPIPGGLVATVTGNAMLLARSADGIAKGQPKSVALAAITIFLVIALGLRSPGLGAVAMIPNLIPVLLFFGLLGLGAAPLSLPTSLIGCIALGIAIDDTVHFLARYREERASGAPPDEAARRSTLRVGRPIAVTSVVLVAGFLVVMLSDFATLQEFGVLSAVTMGICLLNDLVLLPALLIRFRI